MADNIDITPGTGKTVATDEVTIDGATAHVQRIKPVHGTAGNAVDVSTSNPLPVVQTGTPALPTDAATQTTLAAVLTELGSKLEASDLAALATAAKQDTAKAVLDTISATLTAIDGHVDGLEGKDYATQTTLAALLAKVIAAPATEAKQDALAALVGEVQASPTSNTVLDRLKALNTSLTTLAGHVDGLETNTTGLATQTTLASVLTAVDGLEALLAPLTDGTQTTKQVPLSAASVTQVSSSASSTTLKTSNSSRRSLSIFNDSTAALYVKFGATASTSSYTVKIAAGGYYEMPLPVYTGTIDGIWASANGSALITEGT